MFTFPVGLFGSSGSSIIRTVQQVSITILAGQTSGSTNINTVNTNTTFVVYNGFKGNGSASTPIPALDFPRISFSASAVSASIGGGVLGTSSQDLTVFVTVVELGSSVVTSVSQSNLTITSNNTSATNTISAVNTSLTSLFFLGYSTDYPANAQNYIAASANVTLTNSTTVTANRGTVPIGQENNLTLSYVLVQWSNSIVKRVQQANFNFSGLSTTVTLLNAVDTANCMIAYGGWYASSASGTEPYVALTNSTTVTATNEQNTGGIANVTCSVIEFQSGVVSRRQAGSVSMASGVTSQTTSITSVDLSRSLVNWTGKTSGSANQSGLSNFTVNKLTSSTQITTSRGNTPSGNTVIQAWEVIEFN